MLIPFHGALIDHIWKEKNVVAQELACSVIRDQHYQSYIAQRDLTWLKSLLSEAQT